MSSKDPSESVVESLIEKDSEKSVESQSKISRLSFSQYQEIEYKNKQFKIFEPQFPEINQVIELYNTQKDPWLLSNSMNDPQNQRIVTDQSEIQSVHELPNKAPNVEKRVVVTQNTLNNSINENFQKFQPVKVSPDKKQILPSHQKNIESPLIQQNKIQKHISIQPIQSIQKDQNSPYDSHEEDDSSDCEDYMNNTLNMTETVRIPNGSSLLNFKSTEELRKIQQQMIERQQHDCDMHNNNNPFRMSKKQYKPLVADQEELEKSVMGISFNMIQESTSTNISIRESIAIKQTPRKMSLQMNRKHEEVKNQKKNLIFEEFFIIGLDKTAMKFQDIKNLEPQAPTNIYMLNQEVKSNTCQRRMVVKDFCFPNGVQIKPLKKKRVNMILNGQQSSLKENSFVFTLQAQNMNSYDPDAEDEFIYCIATIFEEIIEGQEPNTFFTSQKALCIMAKYRYFDIYLSILNAIMTLYKLERLNILQKQSQNIEQYLQIGDADQILLRELRAAAQVPLVIPDVIEILKQFSKYDPLSDRVDFKNNTLRCQINQKLPQTLRDQQMSDTQWLSSMFLSSLNADDFLKILYAMMLEKSVIFVSDNLPLLSSAVLGMQCFLLPFKWNYVQIAILPKSLIEMVEAPMPFLVGLLKTHLQFVQHSLSPYTPDCTEKLIVYLNDKKKEVVVDTSCIKLPIPNFKKDKIPLIEKLILPFSVLNCSQSSYIVQPTDKQKQALAEIQDLVMATFNELILNCLPAEVISKKKKVNDPHILTKIIGQNAQMMDRQFMEQFINTQMLIQYIENNYCAFD